MRMSEVVRQNPEAVFTNDVQLDWYPSDPKNLNLARCYIFTTKAIEGATSSIPMLQKVRDAFLWGDDNRHVVVADYGRGKTHFALALANYFGQPVESPQFSGIIGRIGGAAGEAVAQDLREFRVSRPPLLVVRLRGDLPQSLSQQFLRGLESAISENEATRGETWPFWFDAAARFLDALAPGYREQANAFLEAERLDLETLKRRVCDRDTSVQNLCIRLHQKLYGTRPDFGSDASLKAVVEWAADTFCSPGQPRAGGILILFDEFSAFIRRYALTGEVGGSASLQDLLSGVANRSQRVVLVAFAHQDPDQTAENAFRASGGTGLDDLRKELQRLPRAARHYLYSSQETVLDSYLQQDEHAFAQLRSTAIALFEDATDTAMTMLHPRYEDNAGWGLERFDSIVTSGCFPLHPLTTGLFSTVRLQEIVGVRSVLDYALREFRNKLDQPALIGPVPNWIWPVALVDWFGEMLGEQEYRNYHAASQQVGPEAPQVQRDVLKAMLLFLVGALKLQGIRFSQAVTALAGHPPNQCEEALNALNKGGYIVFDATRKIYSFWTAGQSGSLLDLKVQEKTRGKLLEWSNLEFINQNWTPARLSPTEVEGVTWGHAGDWACAEVLLTRAEFTAQRITGIVAPFRVDPQKGLVDGVRGCIVRLVAEKEDDLTYFHDHAELVLDSALKSQHPVPIVLAIPEDPVPGFTTAVLKEIVLLNLSTDDRKEFGPTVYSNALRLAGESVEEALKKLRRNNSFVVPQPYRARIRALRGIALQQSIQPILKECFQLAYSSSPQNFFTQYQVRNSNLAKAVRLVSELMSRNELGAQRAGIDQNNNKVPRELRDNFIRPGKAGSWGLVGVGDNVNPPSDTRVAEAWEWLDQVFGAGQSNVPLVNGLIPLLNPPFGYDYNKVMLLFTAWYGYNRRYLRLEEKTCACPIDDYVKKYAPREFIDRLCYVAQVRISRKDPGEEEKKVRAELQAMATARFSIQEAQNLIVRLNTFDSIQENPEGLRAEASRAAQDLEAETTVATKYLEEVLAIRRSLTTSVNLKGIVGALSRIPDLPHLKRVRELDWPSADGIRQEVTAVLSKQFEKECARWETLSKLEDFGLHKARLDEARLVATESRSADLISRADAALHSLSQSQNELAARQRDSAILGEVRAINAAMPLAELRRYRQRLHGMQPASQAAVKTVADKKADLQRAIEDDVERLRDFTKHLEGVRTPDDCQKLSQQLWRYEARYIDSPEQKSLDEMKEKCEVLERYLRVLRRVTSTDIQSLQDLVNANKEIDHAQKESSAHLTPEQIRLADATRVTLQNGVEKKQDAARRWLQNLQSRASGGDSPGVVLEQLARVPPFLPEDQQDGVERLKMDLQGKLDANEVETILHHFRKIRDRVRRDECLRQLQQIVQEPIG